MLCKYCEGEEGYICSWCKSSGFASLLEADHITQTPRDTSDFMYKIKSLILLMDRTYGKRTKMFIAEIFMEFLIENKDIINNDPKFTNSEFKKTLLRKADEYASTEGVDEIFIQNMVEVIATFSFE